MPCFTYVQHGNPAYSTSTKFDVLKLKIVPTGIPCPIKKKGGLEIHTVNIFCMLFEIKFVILTQHTRELS